MERTAQWRGWSVVAFTVLAVAASSTVNATPAAADPKPGPVTPHDLDARAPRDVDNRHGTKAPSDRQRDAAGRSGAGPVRWNAFGEPEALAPNAPVPTGLTADSAGAARRYLVDNQDLYGLDATAVAAMDQLMVRPIGTGTVVLLRQRFGGLPAGHDGLVSILLDSGKVVWVSSSLSRDTQAPAPATLSAGDATAAALRDAGLNADHVYRPETTAVAVPTPQDGPRSAYRVTLVSTDTANPAAYTTFVDARTGGVLVRDDQVDFDADNPSWAVFPATPQGPRTTWCYSPQIGCAKTVRDAASGQAWDVDRTTGQPTFTSAGNSAGDVVFWGADSPTFPATAKPSRAYAYPFADQWRRSKCNPDALTSAGRNDADAAVANLFAMHNRMHDFSYHLGFTESAWNMQVVNLQPGGLGNDAEQGHAQSGALSGSRNNAYQATGPDGEPPVTDMYLWQPVAGVGYPPCADGDFDMTIIGHEYTHAITNRMIAGPDTGLTGVQGGSMGEAWGDLTAAEYLFENNLRAPGDTPFVTGGYVSGNPHAGIRNYDGSRSPLNYSDFGFDLIGPEVHADGEIWVATMLRVRKQFVDRYGLGNPALQQACADGRADAAKCPGNRRWMQLMFDSFLLQAAGEATMVNMRDNLLAADLVRFGGADRDIIWQAFAESGLGEGATGGPSDVDPTPSFHSPYARNATVTLRPKDGAVISLYVGDYEARVTPVADTDPATALPDTFQIVPGTDFHFVVNGKGYGTQRFTASFKPGRAQDLRLRVTPNLASATRGAVASGTGVNAARINDDTEATDWASLDGVAGRQVTIDLAGDRAVDVTAVNVSALLRPAIAGDPDPGPQNRFSALRSFSIQTCNAERSDCSTDAGFHEVYRSRSDAFPAELVRPMAPQLNLRSFDIRPTRATHLRIVVLASQCTGNPLYAGEQDNDPQAGTDCATNNPYRDQVRIAEVQAFGPGGQALVEQ
ncbi:M36 family metallopeptidase [Dactylosporangium vinaceum]|uniref:M36 family metallopeptidase n=1 Tax=Dactylosporangium vinaceum TaxID=53362 RepID=A0ABV5MDM4_9ACTN|nr:M36 family metallopeptidase [Dactylosporangium vinaceum]UAC01112.1 M36 family metallopeptidase [Dactylosporangium vinaceum]